MALSDDQWAVAQAWVGTSEPRTTFEERFTRLGDSLDAAIDERLLALVSAALGQPGSFSLPSGLSVTNSENIRSWRDLHRLFRSQRGTSGAWAPSAGTRSIRRVRPDLR